MKKSVLVAGAIALASAASAANAADAPLWLRYPAISPDGKTIAFCFQGDIFTVPANGGTATQLTSNPAYDTTPVWSPDGSSIAFASDREGSMDVYIVSAKGGAPKRLTTNSVAEYPVTFRDNSTILFRSAAMPDAADIQFPSAQFPQTYSISINGGRPQMFTSLAMENISVNPKTGAILYTDKKGYEDPWRKHHTSSIARDIWTADATGKSGFKKLTDFPGEDRNAVWAPDAKSYYYLSEQDGSFNVYKGAPGAKPAKLTNHTTHPVRFLSIASDGKMAYSYDGELYTLTEGSAPVKVNISIVKDNNEKPLVAQTRTSGATDIAVSPSGKEVAFILHGDVYVTSIEYNTTKRITDTPQQERNIDFSPDGRSLVYSAERGDTWGIYESKIARKDDKLFTYATEITETPLVEGSETSFQPYYSPDGKEVAFLENRTTLRVINLDSKKVRTVLDGKFNYSYTDGDITYRWSPDSKWFLVDYIGNGGWNNRDIALVKADGSGDITNLTESGYSDSNAKWVLDGKAMIWASDRAGYRSHGSWGAEEDTYIMFFDQDAWDRFRLSKEDLELLEEKEKAEKEKKDADKKEDKDSVKNKKKGKKDADKKENAAPAVKDLKFDLDGRHDRIARLTVNSSHMGDALLSPKGDKLYYMSAFESGYDLWQHDLKKNSTSILIKGVGGFMNPAKDGEKVYIATRGGLSEVSFKDAKVKQIPFTAQFNWRPAQEREYIFNHAWRQVLDKFYDPAIHGIDWKGYHDAYARFLPYITNNYDFAEMLGEMLGELNGSHTGARYYSYSSAPSVAALGAFYDPGFKGNGLKVKEVLKGGPLTKADSKIKAGAIIEKIDGQAINANEDYLPLLAGKSGKKVILSGKDASGKPFEQTVTAISAGEQSNLLYKRWIANNRAKVEKLSGGKVGYIHIKGMDSPSFRQTFSDLLGKYRNCDAIIIDTRHNGGGWLHEDLAILLSGKEFARFTPRGNYVGSDPFNRWFKPSCVLVCEDNYSNAHGFPWTYKTLGLGKLIGAPVPGTMTAVWWETQIDPSIVFGIPQVGCADMQGNYLENLELKPDIEVYNTPAQVLAGEDAQLEAAVKEMLNAIKTSK
jgi:Tol biopolymer transport system component